MNLLMRYSVYASPLFLNETSHFSERAKKNSADQPHAQRVRAKIRRKYTPDSLLRPRNEFASVRPLLRYRFSPFSSNLNLDKIQIQYFKQGYLLLGPAIDAVIVAIAGDRQRNSRIVSKGPCAPKQDPVLLL
jgi:hypothetical protein